MSYADPAAGSIRLAVMALPRPGAAGSSAPAGLSGPDLLLNPGGPGESGVQFLSSAASSFPASLRQHFNLVSWDPRGVGQSSPAVQCLSPAAFRAYADTPPAPEGPAGVPAFVASVQSFDRACAAHTSRRLLENISTADSARDMDRLRAALGQQKLTYLGFSYGTYLGYWYALLFPRRVRAMVLDGAVDPTISQVETATLQAQSLEVDLHDFFNWCPGTPSCRSLLPGGARQAFATVMNRLKSGGSLLAQLSSTVGGTQRIHYGDGLTGVVAPLYAKSEWPLLAQALSQALKGNGTLLAALAFEYDGFNSNGTLQNVQAANAATTCADHPSAFSISKLSSLARSLARSAPDFGAVEAYSLYGCTPWSVHLTAPAQASVSRRLPAVVVVGSTHDPVTPFSWAKALSAVLPHSVLLTRVGDGHTGYFASACVRAEADAYLESLKTPAPGTVCQSGA